MRWTFAAPLAVLAAAPGSVHAVQYLTIEQAQRLLFAQAAQFAADEFVLTDAQRQAVAQASGVRVREVHLRTWLARDAQGQPLGRVYLDEVTGKHDLISYALGVDATGHVVGVEILDYRENYGGQIRDAGWRAQFRGKSAADPLKVDGDIANISGATLSCQHVTDGIRRLLAVDALVLKTPRPS